jgi:hypothetical protein
MSGRVPLADKAGFKLCHRCPRVSLSVSDAQVIARKKRLDHIHLKSVR